MLKLSEYKKSLTMHRGHTAAQGQSSQEQHWFGHCRRLDVMLLQQAESESDERSGEAELAETTPAF